MPRCSPQRARFSRRSRRPRRPWSAPSQAPVAQEVDELLASLVRRDKPFPDRTPRQWVIDLAGTSCSASERAQLEVLGRRAVRRREGAPRLSHVLVWHGSWPSLSSLVDALQSQLRLVRRWPSRPALDSAHDDAIITVPRVPAVRLGASAGLAHVAADGAAGLGPSTDCSSADERRPGAALQDSVTPHR